MNKFYYDTYVWMQTGRACERRENSGFFTTNFLESGHKVRNLIESIEILKKQKKVGTCLWTSKQLVIKNFTIFINTDFIKVDKCTEVDKRLEMTRAETP